MPMRLSGLMSGMDTESVIQQLVEARSTKVKKAKNEQTKLEWKQDVWKGLNTKLKSLQSKLNDLRFSGGYSKKATKVSDSSIASVLTDGTAVNGVQSLKVNRLAKTAYLTGAQVEMKAGITGGELTALTPMKFLMDFKNDAAGNEMAKHLTVQKEDGSQTDIQITSDSSISDVLTQLQDAGLNASFDAGQKRFFVSSKEAGAKGNFMLTGDVEALQALGLKTNRNGQQLKSSDGKPVDGSTSLSKLIDFNGQDSHQLTINHENGSYNIAVTPGMTLNEFMKNMKDLAGVDVRFDERQERLYFANDGATFGADDGSDDYILKGLGIGSKKTYPSGLVYNEGMNIAGRDATLISGQDAMIELNGAHFTSSNNVFEINGLTITAQAETDPGKSVTLTTSQDTDGIYNMIKDFLKTYNEVINEMDKLFGADAAKDYEPLTDEEKSNMSESEIEKYEKKIKDALLRKDDRLGSLSSAMRETMLGGIMVNDKRMYLANFGIETLNYFLAPDGERNAFHINGDPDDTYSAMNEDDLKKMIATDPDTVTSFFSQLTMNLYTTMDKQSKSIEGYRSFGSFYDDKKMKSDYDDYKTKIKDLEKKLADYEDKWYAKFARMEKAMAKMQSGVSAVTGLLGGNS